LLNLYALEPNDYPRVSPYRFSIIETDAPEPEFSIRPCAFVTSVSTPEIDVELSIARFFA